MFGAWLRNLTVRMRIISAVIIIMVMVGLSIPLLGIFQSQSLESLAHVIEVDSRSERQLTRASTKIVASQLNLYRFIQDYLPSTANALSEAKNGRNLLREVEQLTDSEAIKLAFPSLLGVLDQYISQVRKVQEALNEKGHPEAVRMAFIASKTGHEIARRIDELVNTHSHYVSQVNTDTQIKAGRLFLDLCDRLPAGHYFFIYRCNSHHPKYYPSDYRIGKRG